MLKIIKSPLNIVDRSVINVIPVDGELDMHQTGYNRFIMLDGNIKSAVLSCTGVMAATLTDKFSLNGKGVVIETPGHFFNEQKMSIIKPGTLGNLSYIDGCSNSNLIDPPRNGDPCLNYLYFPKNINQTFHTHPSVRIGFILSGSGTASVDNHNVNLQTGDVFVLDRHTLHRFSTSGSHMSLMVFHPDSEDGPRDEHNPMKSRTYLS
jgi:mannose-6-phosphate isomerase-like protein (cupin superfamily)